MPVFNLSATRCSPCRRERPWSLTGAAAGHAAASCRSGREGDHPVACNAPALMAAITAANGAAGADTLELATGCVYELRPATTPSTATPVSRS